MQGFKYYKRFTAEECINHPYFEGLHNSGEDLTCSKTFDWSWDNFELKKDVCYEVIF